MFSVLVTYLSNCVCVCVSAHLSIKSSGSYLPERRNFTCSYSNQPPQHTHANTHTLTVRAQAANQLIREGGGQTIRVSGEQQQVYRAGEQPCGFYKPTFSSSFYEHLFVGAELKRTFRTRQ